MNVLCVCEGGNSRSVGLAWLLKSQGHNAVAVGTSVAFNSQWGRQPGLMLCGWADRIVFMADYIEASARPYIPEAYRAKVRICEVGKDTYHHEGLIDPSLVKQCEDQLSRILS